MAPGALRRPQTINGNGRQFPFDSSRPRPFKERTLNAQFY